MTAAPQDLSFVNDHRHRALLRRELTALFVSERKLAMFLDEHLDFPLDQRIQPGPLDVRIYDVVVELAKTDGHLPRLVLTLLDDHCEFRESPHVHAIRKALQWDERRYLHRVVSEIEALAERYSPLRGIARTSTSRALALDSVPRGFQYDPALALLRHRRHHHAAAVSAQQPDGGAVGQDFTDVREAFTNIPQAALLGAPGAGKSTTLWKLFMELATRFAAGTDLRIPVLVRLGNWLDPVPFDDCVASQAPEIASLWRDRWKKGEAVLLLDGLNEIPTDGRAAKVDQIRELLQSAARARTVAIVSCRADDYRDELDLKLDTLTLEPLTPPRIRTALEHWFTCAKDPQPKDEAARLFWQLAGEQQLAPALERWLASGADEESFWKDEPPRREGSGEIGPLDWFDSRHLRAYLQDSRRLLKLAANPFLLSMLYLVWVPKKSLPPNRGALFSDFVDQLLHREHMLEPTPGTDQWRRTAGGEQLVAGLCQLAWHMQRARIAAGPRHSGDFGVLTVISREDARQHLGGEQPLKQALDATLLEGSTEVRFRHQLLQEYFTALALQQRLQSTAATELWPGESWWKRHGWEEVAVLLAGLDSDDCTDIVRWLATAQPDVAATCIRHSGANIRDEQALRAELQNLWLPRFTGPHSDPTPEARAAVGRALGRLDLDNRFGIGVKNGLPEIDWVYILGGEFVHQENERRIIDTFYIARYTITNAQFNAFLTDPNGYGADRWWKGLTEPYRERRSSYWTEPNHPRETVSWEEAVAFCAWLSTKLGFPVSLPTEWQWERAARGADGREYPWGDQFRPGLANVDETHGKQGPHCVGRTTPVGIYSLGATPEPESVHDLAGNVWEWCLNEYEKPKRFQLGGTVGRVLRGGSWLHRPDLACARKRANLPPDDRNLYVGFRVVCSSPSPTER
jgi:hypothetical protein